MARKGEKQLNTFVKGFITEASPLTFPENASLSEDNFVLSRTGLRARRLGIDYEFNYALKASGLSDAVLRTAKMSIHRWDSPSGVSNKVIGVIRIQERLWFVDLTSGTPSANFLNNGNYISLTGLANSEIDAAVINNSLVIVSADLPYTIVLSYEQSSGLIAQEWVPLMVRDIWGVNDFLFATERPASLSQAHKYNLINQGWKDSIQTVCSGNVSSSAIPAAPYINVGSYVDFSTLTNGEKDAWEATTAITSEFSIPAISCTKSQLGVYPSNSDVWSYGKEANVTSANFNLYSPSQMLRNSVDLSYQARGGLIIDAFSRGTSRRNLTGLTALPSDQESGRPSTVESYAGRAFFSGVASSVTNGDGLSPNYNSYIFFSQIVTSNDKIARCYQEADPTSADISDIIDTDGGTIQIPEASKIIKLKTALGSLLVFAENGVWEVYGDTGGFVATSYQVSKVCSIGVKSKNSIVEINGSILFWSTSGIFAVAQDSTSGRFKAENISLGSIQSFYNNLSDLARTYAKGFFEEQENRVRWLFNDQDDYSETNYVQTYNRELVFDLSLQSFYTNSVNISGTNPKIVDYVSMPTYASVISSDEVYVGNDPVLITSLNSVVVPLESRASRTSNFKFLTLSGTSFTISEYRNTDFLDWKIATSTGVNFTSYLITGSDLFQDMIRFKQTPYILFYFNRTETGFNAGPTSLDIENPSSCLVQAQWNWADSPASGKWGTQFQAYTFNRNYTPSGPSDTFDWGESVIVSKRKVRGSGRSLSLYIQSEQGKDLQILGWAISVTSDSNV